MLKAQEIQAIAARLESAVTSNNATEVDLLARDLHTRLLELLAFTPIDVKKALRGDGDAQETLKQAYDLGQLSFAQGFASQIASTSESTEFNILLSETKYKKITQYLLSEELCGRSLANLVDETPESVSRKLKELREAGITDFRREGREVVNFLTGAARAALTAQIKNATKKQSGARSFIKEYCTSLAPHLRGQQTFARQSLGEISIEACNG